MKHKVREVLRRGRGLAGGLLRPPPEIAAQAFERVVLAATALGPSGPSLRLGTSARHVGLPPVGQGVLAKAWRRATLTGVVA